MSVSWKRFSFFLFIFCENHPLLSFFSVLFFWHRKRGTLWKKLTERGFFHKPENQHVLGECFLETFFFCCKLCWPLPTEKPKLDEVLLLETMMESFRFVSDDYFQKSTAV